jgi:ribonuclease R
VPHLEALYELYLALRRERVARGALDFDTTEPFIRFGADRKIQEISARERTDAHRVIEECMVAANVAAAQWLLKQGIPALFRVHDGPGADKLADLRSLLGELGLELGGGKRPEPRHYAQLLEEIGGRPDAHLLQTVLLRSLSQAVYQPKNTGHFGLGYKAYTHFTSPIRRYPDLLVHRAIRHLLYAKGVEALPHTPEELPLLGEHCSMTERRADEATWDAVEWLKCEFMLDKVGQVFDGIISGVTGFGLFVELNDIYVQGLVHITSLEDDYYHFDPVRHRLRGERTGRSFQLGDPLKVQVARVDLDERKLDFEPAVRRRRTPPRAGRKRSKRT